MKISNLLFALATALAFTGCRNTIEGHLKVEKSFNAKSTVSQPCSGEGGEPCYVDRMVQIKAGDYKSKISFNSRTELEVQVKGNSTQTLKVKVPSNVNIPENGEFALSSSQSGQPFNIAGVVATESQRSDTRRERESCWAERWETECFVTGNPPQHVCREVRRTYPGYQTVEFYYIDTKQNLNVNLAAADGSQLAQFVGAKQTREKRIIYQSACW